MLSERFAKVHCFAWSTYGFVTRWLKGATLMQLLFDFFNRSNSLQINENPGATSKLNCLEQVSGLILRVCTEMLYFEALQSKQAHERNG